MWWVTEIVQLVPGEILLPLLYWLVSIWENRNHIWYFFLFFFFLHMVLLIERFLYGDLVTKYWESWKKKKPPWCHLEIIQHGKELSIVLRAAGLGVDVIPEPLCAALYCSQAEKSELACLLLTLLDWSLMLLKVGVAQLLTNGCCRTDRKQREKWLLFISCLLI